MTMMPTVAASGVDEPVKKRMCMPTEMTDVFSYGQSAHSTVGVASKADHDTQQQLNNSHSDSSDSFSPTPSHGSHAGALEPTDDAFAVPTETSATDDGDVSSYFTTVPSFLPPSSQAPTSFDTPTRAMAGSDANSATTTMPQHDGPQQWAPMPSQYIAGYPPYGQLQQLTDDQYQQQQLSLQKQYFEMQRQRAEAEALKRKNPPYQVDETGERIKRPMNAFMIWSRMKRDEIQRGPTKKHNSVISKELGEIWRQMSDAEKRPFQKEAKKLKEDHQQKYPEYKYQPVKRKARRASVKSLSPSTTVPVYRQPTPPPMTITEQQQQMLPMYAASPAAALQAPQQHVYQQQLQQLRLPTSYMPPSIDTKGFYAPLQYSVATMQSQATTAVYGTPQQQTQSPTIMPLQAFNHQQFQPTYEQGQQLLSIQQDQQQAPQYHHYSLPNSYMQYDQMLSQGVYNSDAAVTSPPVADYFYDNSAAAPPSDTSSSPLSTSPTTNDYSNELLSQNATLDPLADWYRNSNLSTNQLDTYDFSDLTQAPNFIY